MRRHCTCLVPRYFTGERVGQKSFLQVLVAGIVTNHMSVSPTVLMRPDRSKQCSLSAVLDTYLRFLCVTNCDFSADIHCVFWAVCADTVPVFPPLFHGRTGWAEKFFAGFSS